MIGVIGLNGSGKSSLLRILAGVDKEIIGETVISSGYTVGYLEQEPLIDDARTVRQVVEEAVQETGDTEPVHVAVTAVPLSTLKVTAPEGRMPGKLNVAESAAVAVP